jgi:AraC-like DNA-binding protein
MGAVQRAASNEAFFASPHGRYLAAAGVVYWCHGPSFWGVSLSGTFAFASVAQLIAWIEEEHRQAVAPYATLVDLRHIRAVDADAFALFEDWYRAARVRQASRVTRAVIVRPSKGLAATAIAGMPSVLGPIVPCLIVTDLAEGLSSLELDDVPRISETLDAMMSEAGNVPAVLLELRAALERSPSTEVAALGRELGCSVRTLQRRLREQGTSFEAERNRARVARAQQYLSRNDDKLAAVALEAGFSTQAHFTEVFRRWTGETPSAFRARVRSR